jgi:5,5'-dehydrodivanillate O-demethylase oxygenase subunit
MSVPTTRHDEADYSDFVHIGPESLAGQYLRRFWHPICLSRGIEPGRARKIRVLGTDFTLYRGEDGAPHLVDLRCAHRGAQLWTGWVEGDCIRCMYHGWKYDGAGRCVDQPAEDSRSAQRIKISGYPIEDYLGLVFAYIGPREAPPLPRYIVFDRPGLKLRHVSFIGEYSYIQNLENLVDPVHAAFTHRSFFDRTGAAMASVKVERSRWGITISRAGIGQGVSQLGMPNVFQIGGALATPGALSMVWVVPIDDENHRFYSVRSSPDGDALGGDADEPDPPLHELNRSIIAGETRLEDYEAKLSPIHFQLLQDIVIQSSQGIIADRSRERLGRSDRGVSLLRRLWRTELQALAEGRPLTAWEWTPELTKMDDWHWAEAGE